MKMKGFFFFTSALAILALLPVTAVGAGLKVGFYNKTCPSAEALVQQAVAAAFQNNSGIAAGLIRLHFHDCFVKGCDGSVLIDSTANNTAEKDAIPNKPSLRGFEVIDAAKKAVEAQCPRTVSCADIVAFAARDSIALTGNVTYKVPAGRRDGRVSTEQGALDNLPSPSSNASVLVGKFAAKNLTAKDMVVLSGAHTVGRSHCDSFTKRLYNFSNASDVDPTISSAYAFLLKNICPANSSQFFPNTTTDMDLMTPDVLDNKYYLGLTNNLGLFTSDQALLTNATLKASVDEFVKSENRWKSKFVKAMVKMGGIEVLTGTQGEIRLNCRVINSGSSAGIELRMTGSDDSAEEFTEIATN
ncbi:peroxidase 1-like [Phragmites australis]|uniref:peroxidase 1-like n=1 Tax=Phragmites australis TaxID=29695 RepID=UPI002D76CD1D|nr:peroxidase 1-like [Phragmites australis]